MLSSMRFKKSSSEQFGNFQGMNIQGVFQLSFRRVFFGSMKIVFQEIILPSSLRNF